MRSTVAEINLSNLKHNLEMLRQTAPKTEIMGVVKADAYGHGAIEIARFLRSQNVKILGVAFADEAVRLRQSGDNGEIFVTIPGTEYDTELYCAYNIQSSIEDIEIARKLSREAHDRNMKVKAHLFINTGMNRDGIHPEDALKFTKELTNLEGIDLIGIITHLASTELEDRSFAEHQIRVFNKTLNELLSNGYNFKYVQAANSAGILNYPEIRFNLARAGIALYGYMDYKPLSEQLGLKPILTLKSRVININKVSIGDFVGYSCQYKSPVESKIAVVPIGYGDGYHRTLSNKAECLIKGKRYKLVGTICMDQCLVDIGNDDISVGDEVVFIGTQGNESITAYELATAIGTIPYEITTALKLRVPRVYTELPVENF